MAHKPYAPNSFRERVHTVIFEADTPLGRFFDIALLVLIVLSVLTVLAESVEEYALQYGRIFWALEIIFTALFTIEYALRLYAVYRPWQYATSFFGIVDLLSILPTYLTFFFVGTGSLLVIRALRLLRVFRIFKLGHFMKEGAIIVNAMRASWSKILVFLFFIMLVVTIIGAIMYLIEGSTNEAFTSIPRSIYWAIVTLTTVGYGDITPQTAFGQFLSAAVMILGYAVIAVPTGIVTNELIIGASAQTNTQACRFCGREGHDDDAAYCKHCGELLNPPELNFFNDNEEENIV